MMRNDILTQAEAIRAAMNTAGKTLTDEQAAESMELYEFWSPDSVKYEVNDRRRDGEKLYKCRQEHLSQADWKPSATPALWTVIDISHAGTIDDPIPAERGMEYTYGLYYLDPEDGNVYLCERGTETGTVVLHYLPHEVVGNYFTLVTV